MNWFCFCTIIIVGVVAHFGIIYQHEIVHKEIYEEYDIDSRIEIKWDGSGRTISDERCPTEECTLAHNINDAITYPLLPFFQFFVFVMAILMGVVAER